MRLAIRACVAVLLVAALFSVGAAQDIRFLRIGTAATSGTYFPVGGLIASIISNPPGSLDCERGGSCGVPGVIASAVSTQGSVDNIQRLVIGDLDMALSQADVAFDAFVGRGGFSPESPFDSIRAIARLYPEALHVVVRAGSGIASIPDLAGKRVSLGERKSGTLVVARVVLKAFGLEEEDLSPVYEPVGSAIDALVAGELDAVFLVGGYPVAAIAPPIESGDATLIHVKGRELDAVRDEHPYLGVDVIPEGTYVGIGGVVTLQVGALLITSSDAEDDLIYEVTRALWNARNRPILDQGHPNGARIQLHNALNGVPIPIHPGAARYYQQVGLLQDDMGSVQP